MRNWKFIALATIGGMTLLTTTAGAAGTNSNGIQHSATPVLKNKLVSQAPTKGLKSEELDNTAPVGWLGENKILVLKANTAKDKINDGEGFYHYPTNLYIHDVVSGKDTLIKESKRDISLPTISPDQQSVLYKGSDGWNILTIKSGRTVKAASINEVFLTDGSWSDSKHFIYPTMKGDLVSVRVDGKSETVLKTGKSVINYVKVVGSTIYYSYYVAGQETQLMSYNVKSKKTITLLKNVERVIPSPNSSQLAMVKVDFNANVPRTLVLTDLNGKEKATLLSDNQIYAVSWSPDNSTLAFVVESNKSSNNGSYIYNLKTGNKVKLAPYVDVAPSLPWSPSGKKILIPYSAKVNKEVTFKTSIVTIS